MNKGKIFKMFMEHPIFKDKYSIPENDVPDTIESALVSDYPIIKTIAMIVDEIESDSASTHKSIEQKIRIYLNNSI